MDIQSGAVIDNRSEGAKIKDYQLKEAVASAFSVVWMSKTVDERRKFPIFNQNGSGSCVAQTEAKELGIMRWLKDGEYVHFSATDIYQRRSNKLSSGMAAVDARGIITKGGATLEVLAPSQNLTDTQMDGSYIEPYKRAVGEIFKVPNYLELPFGDIETVASTIQSTGKGVMVWFYFKADEWTDHPVVKHQDIQISGSDTIRHSVTAVDFCLVDGKKCLIIEDSWGPNAGIGGQRVIDEDFYKARNWYASYLINFKFEEDDSPPLIVSQFLTDLEFGQTGEGIVLLQNRLKREGLFPSNINSTGYFGAITKKAVEKYQLKYNITTPDGLGYGRVGPLTRSQLNK
jgi:hypothetical protein